ncbi:sulfatase [Actinoplanes sp. NPDC051494]|uniref:sulfatase n=1 Tax=Actinoplanes sp. NPDC051494 TaxID=3363907 RepID=UPI0037B8B5D3
MSRTRRVTGGALTGLAGLFVLLCLIVPERIARLPEGTSAWVTLIRVPIEGFATAAVLLVLPRRARTVTATVLGVILGVLTVLKLIDIGFRGVLVRPFDPVLDWSLFADGYRFVRDSFGLTGAILTVAGIVVLTAGIPVGTVLALRRLAATAARHQTASRRTVLAAVVAWVTLAASGVAFVPGIPVASDSVVTLARDKIGTIPAAVRDERAFTAAAAVDAFRDTAPDQLLTGLRGKDVVFTFVESYGRSALEDPGLAAVTGPALAQGTKDLTAAGYASRSGFLTSPTAGGGSWLAHSTFQSGVWIDNQQRYRSLVAGDRLTLTSAFRKAGAWRTVGVEPGVTYAWPEGAFYGYDHIYDSHTLGYQGPAFGWSPVPDQFTLKSFTDNEYHRPGRGPLLAEITLVSSHTPWAPLPSTAAWDQLGDGSLYSAQHEQATSTAEVWKDTDRIRTAYATSIAYSVGNLISWVREYGDDNLVLVFLGDHQPAPVVVGDTASHDVPVTIVAHDQHVLDQIAGWGWTDGLRPGPDAPVWPMDEFRDRFLTAFGPAAPGK